MPEELTDNERAVLRFLAREEDFGPDIRPADYEQAVEGLQKKSLLDEQREPTEKGLQVARET